MPCPQDLWPHGASSLKLTVEEIVDIHEPHVHPSPEL
jgi:hypothetical protein